MAENITLRGPLLDQLAGGDRWSVGEANLVVDKILAEPERLIEIIGGLFDPDAIVRSRAAHVAEKVSAVHPDWLAPFKAALLRRMQTAEEKEERSRLAQMAPRLPLEPEERKTCVARLAVWLADNSRTVQASSLDALGELALADSDARGQVLQVLETCAASETHAVRVRALKILTRLR